MALKFNFEKTFSNDGYAIVDDNVTRSMKASHMDPGFFITDINQSSEKKNNILNLWECKPPPNYKEGNYIKLPSNVDFERVVNNIIDSFKNDSNEKRQRANKQGLNVKEGEEEKTTKKYDAWKKELCSEENKFVISDAFWYMICKWHEEEDDNDHGDQDAQESLTHSRLEDTLSKMEYYKEVDLFLKKRLAKNYVNLFLSVDEKHKESFFQEYFNILSQGVFYSFFYAFPKSRDDFNNEVKKKFLLEFSELFTGIKISNPATYYSKWYLDLGAGNILKSKDDDYEEDDDDSTFESAQSAQLKITRVTQELKYSPIMQEYLSKDFKTKNIVKGYKMRFSKMSDNQEEIEAKFSQYKQIAKEINLNKIEFIKQAKKDKKKLVEEIQAIKDESQKHMKRLAKRRDEELEKGAHEYANYLVSMLNAGK